MKTFDIAVIGGGASGLTAAISAKRTDMSLDIAVIERLSRVGKKILSTGNGRCNFTNSTISEEHYFGSCKELYSLCVKYPTEDLLSSLGILPVTDDHGRVYPNSNTASSVLDALRLETDSLGIEIICDFEVSEIKKGFIIHSTDSSIKAERIIIAGGGKSQRSLGSNGSMLDICKSMGIKTKAFYPVLTSLKTDSELIRPLKGQRISAKATAYINGKEVASDIGEVQFGDGVISGICIFNLSCVQGIDNSELVLDLLPNMDIDKVLKLFTDIREIRRDAMLEDYLSGVFNKRIAMFLIKQSTQKNLSYSVSALSDTDIKKIADKAKNLRFTIKGVSGFEKSQVSGGGVLMSEIDDTLRSRKIKELYLCGEILDIHGECGGYNLSFAFSSGIHAGICAVKNFRENSDDQS